MSIHLYHPNKSAAGSACSFGFKNSDFFATIVKQSGVSEDGNGAFKENMSKDDGHVNVKFSQLEVCAILDCIDNNRPYSSYHKLEESSKGIKFEPWFNTDKQQRGFSFSIVVNKNSFYIGLNFSEARLLKEYIVFFLNSSFEKFNAKNDTTTS